MPEPYELIIFDWDGTLVDSEAQIVKCMELAFAGLGMKVPAASALRHIVGLSLETAFFRLAPEATKSTINRLVEAYRQQAFTNTKHSTELFDGVRNGLGQLREQGFYLAVATGKGRRGLEAALRGSDLSGFFDITRCADETCSKPDPLMLDEILINLDISVDRALMIGDTSYDIEMANSIGMDSVAVTYGMHEAHHLRPLKPRYLINQFSEIHNLIGEKTNV